MAKVPDFSSTVLLITRNGMGFGDESLQKKLLENYLNMIIQNGSLPSAICFYTEGVRLVTEGSPVLDALRDLEQKGVNLIACSTCLGFYGLTASVKVGIVGGLGDILEAEGLAHKVITL
ncbi:MAG: DsrE family protein [Anaerolineales bacterium]|jgi:intracellular sulfur oxidation DsrE/DsrF family protein